MGLGEHKYQSAPTKRNPDGWDSSSSSSGSSNSSSRAVAGPPIQANPHSGSGNSKSSHCSRLSGWVWWVLGGGH